MDHPVWLLHGGAPGGAVDIHTYLLAFLLVVVPTLALLWYFGLFDALSGGFVHRGGRE